MAGACRADSVGRRVCSPRSPSSSSSSSGSVARAAGGRGLGNSDVVISVVVMRPVRVGRISAAVTGAGRAAGCSVVAGGRVGAVGGAAGLVTSATDRRGSGSGRLSATDGDVSRAGGTGAATGGAATGSGGAVAVDDAAGGDADGLGAEVTGAEATGAAGPAADGLDGDGAPTLVLEPPLAARARASAAARWRSRVAASVATSPRAVSNSEARCGRLDCVPAVRSSAPPRPAVAVSGASGFRGIGGPPRPSRDCRRSSHEGPEPDGDVVVWAVALGSVVRRASARPFSVGTDRSLVTIVWYSRLARSNHVATADNALSIGELVGAGFAVPSAVRDGGSAVQSSLERGDCATARWPVDTTIRVVTPASSAMRVDSLTISVIARLPLHRSRPRAFVHGQGLGRRNCERLSADFCLRQTGQTRRALSVAYMPPRRRLRGRLSPKPRRDEAIAA